MTGTTRTTRAQQFFSLVEGWRAAEKLQHDYAMRKDPIGHHYNKLLSDHIGIAQGKDAKLRPRAKAVLRHFVKWQEIEQVHREKHKKPFTMDDLAAQKPKALKAWRHYRRYVAPKEKRYHKEMWLLKQETGLSTSTNTKRKLGEAEENPHSQYGQERRPVILLEVNLPLTSREVRNLQYHAMDRMMHDLHLNLGNTSSYETAHAVFVFHLHLESQARHIARLIANYIHREFAESPIYQESDSHEFVELFHAIFDPVTRDYHDPIPGQLSTIPY